MSDTEQPKKKSKGKKIVLILLALLIVGGGGAGAGLYAMNGSLTGGATPAVDPNVPQLVAREGASAAAVAAAMPQAQRGRIDPRVFQATYFPMETSFTSNLSGGDAFVQIGLGVSTFYDQRVIDNLTRHEMAVRSAILLTLSEQDPLEIRTLRGKEALKAELRNAINSTLTNREGFGGIDDVYFTSFVTQ